MTRRLLVRPQALVELEEAVGWYDVQDKARGDEFLQTFETVVRAISGNPFQYQRIYKNVRRARLGRFPHGLLYTATDDDVIVISCFRGRRDPRRWQRRERE